MSARPGSATASRPKRVPRRRPLPPDVTARNLAYEKQRRGDMNDKLMELASFVPALSSMQRRNKVLIVNKTIEHLRQQREMCIAAARDVDGLLSHYHRLLLEVNMLRAQVVGPDSPLVQPLPVTTAMQQLASIETRTSEPLASTSTDIRPDDASNGEAAWSDSVLGTQMHDLSPPLNNGLCTPLETFPATASWNNQDIPAMWATARSQPQPRCPTSAEHDHIDNALTDTQFSASSDLEQAIPASLYLYAGLNVPSNVSRNSGTELNNGANLAGANLQWQLDGVETSLFADIVP